ncbi:MAG: hypothetical protein WBG95_14215 [Sulfitobacter sp.]
MTMPHSADLTDFDATGGEMTRSMAQNGWYFHKAYDGPFDRFQVLGERGCGTNLLRKSITKTHRIMRTEALGWKHAVPMMIAVPPSFLTVCIVREARGWATSLYNRPWHSDPSLQQVKFPEFLRTPWIGSIEFADQFEIYHPELDPEGFELQWDRHPLTGRRYANLFEMRNVKHQGLLSLPARGGSVAYVTLERFNADPRAFLDAMGEIYGLLPTERGYRPVTRRMGNQWRSAYQRDPAPADWPTADVAWMNSQIDPRIEAVFGYVSPEA